MSKIWKGIKYRIWTPITLKKEGRLPFAIESAGGISSPEIAKYAANLYREVQLLRKALGGTRFNRSLEVGCGYGRITPWIMKYSKEHHAIEPEPVLLKLATKLYPEVKFSRATAQKLPFPDGYFDFIVTFSVLHHIPPKEFEKAVQEIKRVARSNATIFLHERVKGKGGYKFRSWPRPVDTYKRLFSGWKLVRVFDRKTPGIERDKSDGIKIMLFKSPPNWQKTR